MTNNSIYKYPSLYDDIMWWKKDDIVFWSKIIKKYKIDSVLELCCGTGRIGIPLIDADIDYHGIDISQNFIDHFKQKLKNTDYDTNQLYCGNIIDFDIGSSFDLIFIGFNSFAHILTNKEALDSFLNIRKHMHSKSIFAFDIFVPDPSFLYRKKNDKINIMDFLDSTNNQKLNILESTNFNTDTEINHIDWLFTDFKNVEKFKDSFDMRMYFPDTLNRLLIDSKFRINKFYGSYDLTKFNEQSEKQIYLCSK